MSLCRKLLRVHHDRCSVCVVRSKVSRSQRIKTHANSPNFNFLRTGKSAYEFGHTDMTPENIDFLREQYAHNVIANSPLKNSSDIMTPQKYQMGVRRCGAVGMKLGSYPLYQKDGSKVLCTLVQLVDTQVVDIQRVSDEEINRHMRVIGFKRYNSKFPRVPYVGPHLKVVVGCNNISPEFLSAQQMRMYERNGIPCKESIVSFVVPKESAPPIGTQIFASHFVPGQLVSIVGRSVDRGFQGVMKRWGFKGLPKTHGVTLAHRAAGAKASSDMGRIIPRTRTEGQMGDKKVYRPNCHLLRINTAFNVLYISGLLPGLDGSFITIRDAFYNPECREERKMWHVDTLPYPTYSPAFHDALPEDVYAPSTRSYGEPPLVFEPDED